MSVARKDLGQSTILVVDDNENNRYALVRRLEREGYRRVITAEDGASALETISTQSVDLVLLDIMMPGMSGYEVLERLREGGRLPDLPVIVVSAVDEIDSVVRCIELGAEDYVGKPFNTTLLRARIHAVLERKMLRDERARQLGIIREVFGKYVPEGVADGILAGEGQLQPTHTTATILYTDIADFTRISEGIEPAQVVQMLNEYFPAVIEPVLNSGGVVNQFQGDAMLVTFNVPIEDQKHAEHAATAALGIQAVTRGRRFAGVELFTRMGINTGDVIAGNVGSGERVTYTVHGDAVNVAARLESLNKELGTQILVSAETAALLGGQFELADLGPVDVRGRNDALRIYGLGN
ncbi:MAG: adenylate/guanylate cyclase domain-containing protein [Gammaproteobacteria bacterium]